MNDIAQKATADKFLSAIKKEGLSKKEAGASIGLIPAQVSYLFNDKYWERLGNTYWDRVLAWVNSGQSLKEYSEKHGKVVAETKPEKSVSKTNETVPDKPKTVLKTSELGSYPRQNIAGELVYKEKITLIDLLQERRRCLVEETNAIDNLLRHYDFLIHQ